MEKQSLIAVLLSLVVLIGYQYFISHFYPSPPPNTLPPSETQTTTPVEKKLPLPGQPQEEGLGQRSEQPLPSATTANTPSPREFTIENDVYTAVFSSLGGTLKSLHLKQYPGDEGRNSAPREMIAPGPQGELPIEVRLEGKGITDTDAGVPYQVIRGNNTVSIQGDEQSTLEFRGTTANGATITKRLTFSGRTYGIGLEIQVENAPQNVSLLSVVWTHALGQPHKSATYSEHGPVTLIGRKFFYQAGTDLVEKEKLFGPDRIRWAGYGDTYFLSAIIPPEGDTYSLLLSAKEGTVAIKLAMPWNRQPVTYTVYVGPKELSALNAVNPSLERAIDFGWSHFIARPLLSLLKLSHSLTGNYGIDIILLTILVKLIFFPLSLKSFKSMAAMQKLQPQLEQLRTQYQNDRETLNREMMEMYRRHKINPLGGCLPLLVQFPVFIGLYQVLMMAIEIRQAPFFGWIQDLSRPDRLGTFVLPFVDPPGIPVLTVLMGGTMIMQQAITPTPGDPVQQKMMMLMPLIFTVMFVNFPAGLVLYWLVNNVLSITQQYAYNKGLV